MKTYKHITTISYNTVNFLVTKLDELVQEQVISFYAFITHQPDTDDTKVHHHLYMIPNGTVDTYLFENQYFKELDPNYVDLSGASKPRNILPCRVQTEKNFGHWYYYTLHDTVYLSSRGLERNIHYDHCDYITSSAEFFNMITTEISRIDYLNNKKAVIVNAIKTGISKAELLMSDFVPIQSTIAVNKLYDEYYNGISLKLEKCGDNLPFITQNYTYANNENQNVNINNDILNNENNVNL